MRIDPAVLKRRNAVSAVMLGLCVGAALVSILVLSAILWELLLRGVGALSLEVFTQTSPPPGSKGGLANAIVGSLMMTGLGILIATPFGVLTGSYLAEYARHSKLSQMVRFINDTLLSAPSIIIGLFVYAVVVVPMGHFSGWAGALALAIIATPVIVRTTEDMLLLVPDQLREASVALGMPVWRMVVRVSWRAASKGILTGILLALARISGETAPLLFTALNNQFMTINMNAPMPSLPVVIFQFAMSPYKDWQQLAWAGAMLISFSVLLLNIIARTMASKGDR